MSLKNFFSNNFETSSSSSDEKLRSHYYGNDYNTVKNNVLEIAGRSKYQVLDVNDEYKEILINIGRGELIVTLFNKSFYEVSVDFKIMTNYLIGFGRGRKLIISYYENLNRLLNLKHIGD